MRANAAPAAEPGPGPGLLTPQQLPRSFIDREQHKALFSEILTAPAAGCSRVQVWHGAGGQGKTALRCEFERLLGVARAQRSIALCTLDLELPHLRRDPVETMLALRTALAREDIGDFPNFDLAFVQLFALEHPGRQVREAHPDLFHQVGNEVLADLASLGSWAGSALLYKYSTRALGHLRDWLATAEAQEEIGRIQAMPAHRLRERLPAYLGADLNAALARRPGRRVVLMLDAYEALWRDAPGGSQQNLLVDDWVRGLVRTAPGLLVLVFCRDALKWPAPWDDLVEQHPLDALPIDDALRLLARCGVASPAVRERIAHAAQGLPFFLECALETYGDIVQHQGRVPEPDDFGATHPKVLDRFLAHLPDTEIKDLELASYGETIDNGLLRALSRSLYGRAADWPRLCRRSLVVRQQDGSLRMHALLREALQQRAREADPDFYAEAHAFLFTHHDRLLDTAAAQLGPTHEDALRLALHHRLQAALPDTVGWLLQRQQVFADAGRWIALDRAFRRVATALGPFTPDASSPDADAVWFHHHHASVLQHMGAFADAIVQYRLALAHHPQDARSRARPRYATILDALANVHREIGENAAAEPLYQQAVAIYDAAPEQFPIRHAWALWQLARCHGADGRTESAQRHAARARGLFDALADTHPREYAGFLLDLGRDLLAQAQPDEAIGLLDLALQRYRRHNASPDGAATTLLDIAVCRARLGDAGRTTEAFDAAVDAHTEVYGAQHPNTGHARHLRAAFWLGAPATAAQARPELAQATQVLEQSLGPAHAWTRAARADLARAEATAPQ